MARRAILLLAVLTFGFAIGRWSTPTPVAQAGAPIAQAEGEAECTDVGGDSNGDRMLNISDPVRVLSFLFQGGPAPTPVCAGDVTSDNLSVVAIVRHAEKAAGNDPPLTKEGHARAATLARALESFPVTDLIASDLQRTQQTIAPLSKATGVDLTITPSATADGSIERVAEIIRGLDPGSMAVVAHHSFTIPGILKEFDVDVPTPRNYDNFWMLLMRGDKVVAYLPLRVPAEGI